MLADILIKTPEQRIFSLFAMNPDRPFYLREISRRLNISLGATYGALIELEKARILTSRTIGKTKLFEVDAENSQASLKSFRVLTSVLILEPLVELLKSHTSRVILYGSYARGTFSLESDLDLFIVSDEREVVLGQINYFLRNIEIDIRPVIMGSVEWMNLEKADPEFFREVTGGFSLWEEQLDESGF